MHRVDVTVTVSLGRKHYAAQGICAMQFGWYCSGGLVSMAVESGGGRGDFYLALAERLAIPLVRARE